MEKYHFIGVGGIGMSALARILIHQGVEVTGSDMKGGSLLDQLEKEGVKVARSHDPNLIQEGMTIVYSTDIKKDNCEWKRGKELGLTFLHRSDLLEKLMTAQKPLLVTGTHGKTTTTSLLAATFLKAELDPSFAVGGILLDCNTNGRGGKGPFFIAEADESDGSFLKTKAFGAIVTNLDLDHLDFWGNEEKLTAAFTQFFSQVQNENYLFWCCDDEKLSRISSKGISYGFSSHAACRIADFEQNEDGIFFTLFFQGKIYSKIFLTLFGKHNALNGAAVFALSISLGISEESIRAAFSQFQGAKRRLEWKGRVRKVDFFDDYGHHPKEITVTLQALRAFVKERRLIVLFQPHRFTRVRDLFDLFPKAFFDADLIVMTDIYSAGEATIANITTEALYAKMKEKWGNKLHYFPRMEIENKVADLLQPLDAVIAFGAGDIVQAITPLQAKWDEKQKKMKVAIICGGKSAEHEVSIQSAQNVASWADLSIYELCPLFIGKEGTWNRSDALAQIQSADVAIPVMHGPFGEDGMMQGFLDTLGIAYAGCDYATSALCMNKRWTKDVAVVNQIPTVPYLFFTSKMERKEMIQRIEKQFSYPLWVKPVHLGSSIGVNYVENKSQLEEKIEIAFSFDSEILIEPHIEGKQIEFGVIGNDYLWVGPPCEIINQGNFVGYEQKYGDLAFPYQIPASISYECQEKGRNFAKKVYEILGCKGLARVDFFYCQGEFLLNEVNTFPGCTQTSAFPKICEEGKLSFEEVFDRLIVCALHRKRE